MLRDLLENQAFTQNGAISNRTTGSNLLNFFATAGSARNKPELELIQMFEKAYADDPIAATVLLFYFRDVREGQGERRLFRVVVNHFAKTQPSILKGVMSLIPEYGRWDDMYLFVGTPLETEAFRLMKKQWNEDQVSEYPSLLAKWLKGTRPSSKESNNLMHLTARHFGFSLITYQKSLARLRRKLNIVETKMAEGNWDEINYSHVPSHAMKTYFKAFLKHDGERFKEYLDALSSKDEIVAQSVKINASTLYPHDVVYKARMNQYGSREENQVYNAQWKALPKFPLEDTISIVDVSGSMFSTIGDGKLAAIDVSLALGIYTAENLRGEFKDAFLTFSDRCSLEVLVGDDLTTKVRNLQSAEWGMTTNIEAAFKLILDTATENNLLDSEIPKRLLVISDMQFNQASRRATNYNNAKRMFEEVGYTFPQLIFWNVMAAPSKEYPIKQTDNALLLSGYSPVILKYIYKNEMVSPLELVYEVVNAERYSQVVKILEKLYL